MMSCFAYPTSNTTRNIIFKITIKSLVLRIFNFKIGKVTSAMLGSQRSLFHVDICILFLLFRISVIATGITTILIIKRTIWGIIWYFTHTFRIYGHWLMCFLSHSEYLTHWWRSWGRTIYSGNVSFLHYSILLPKFFKIWMLQRLSCRHPMIMIVYQKFLNNVTCFRILRY